METLALILKMIGVWFVAMILSSAVHEGSHVVAGLVQGWRFLAYCVGPFKLYRDDLDGKVKIGLEKNPALWGGYGGTVPVTMEDAKVESFGKILLAGPMASVFLGLIAAVPGLMTKDLFLMLLMGVSIAMGVACLIPGVKTGILYNDGSRYLRIRRGGQEAAEEKAILDAAFRSLIEPESRCPEENIHAMLASKDKEFQYLGHYYAYQNAQMAGDEGKKEACVRNMKEMQDKVPRAILDMCPID